MEITIRQGEEFIRLGQALKKAGIVGSGLDAKMIILEESVQVNGATETRRGRMTRLRLTLRKERIYYLGKTPKGRRTSWRQFI